MSSPVRVEMAATAARLTDERLRATVRAARAGGVPVSHLARAAGVTRQTIYRWLGEWARESAADAARPDIERSPDVSPLRTGLPRLAPG